MDEIISRCKVGDVTAQSILYEVYACMVYRTAYLLTKSKVLSEDITQETFIRVFSKISLFKKDNSFDSWLYSVTLNVSKNILRKQKWVKLFSPLNENKISENSGMVGDEFEDKERNDLLKNVIDMLPYKLKEVIILKYYNDLSQEQISDILKIPIGTVKSRIHNGLKKIRGNIDKKSSLREVFLNE